VLFYRITVSVTLNINNDTKKNPVFSLARSMHLSITLYEESSQYLEEEEEEYHLALY
jgi:hypothetical protein